jgi:hypothetical protein
MAVTIPDWLSKHGGDLRGTPDGKAYAVFLDGEPQYVVVAVPAAGKYGTEVKQSVNGKRFESGATYPTAEEAVRGGLEDLRKALGW